MQLPIYNISLQKCQAFFQPLADQPLAGTCLAKNQKTSLKEQKLFGMFEEICQAVWHWCNYRIGWGWVSRAGKKKADYRSKIR